MQQGPGSKCSFSLWLSAGEQPELLRTSFRHPLLEDECLAVRGKSAGAYSNYNSFQWTPAVKALVILALRSAAAEDVAPRLEGATGTPASSLDYALAKQPIWLHEIFGSDSGGDSLARRIILRSNPEQRLPGPVALSFDSRLLSATSITIYCANQRVTDNASLQRLAGLIERVWRPMHKPRVVVNEDISPNAVKSLPQVEQKHIRRMLREEILSMLRGTDIFNRKRFAQRLERVHRDPSFRRVASRDVSIISDVDRELLPSDRLGLACEEEDNRSLFAGDEPLRFAIPFSLPSAIALTSYLQGKGYNIETNVRYAHAVEIANRIIDGDFVNPPDACVLGLAPAATILSRGDAVPYRPLMIMPQMTHRVVSAQTQKEARLNDGEYGLLSDDPSTALFYFDRLTRRGSISRSRIAVKHMEPDEVWSAIAEGDSDFRSVLFFPHYHLHELLRGTQYLDSPAEHENQVDAVLFVHERIARDHKLMRALDVALRDAWLELRSGGTTFETTVDKIASSPDYLKAFHRFSGIEAAVGLAR